MSLNLFCPHCDHYLGPYLAQCHHCKQYSRPPQEILPPAGQPFWQADLPGAAAGAPHLHNGLLVAAWRSRSKEPPAEGGLVWLDPLSGKMVDEAWNINNRIVGQPAFDGRSAFVCLGSDSRLEPGAVAAVDLETHRLRWGPLPLEGALACGPVVIEQRVYAACGDGQVYCFDALDGHQLITTRFLPSSQIMAGPAALVKVHNNLVLAASGWGGQIFLITRQGAYLLAELQDFVRKLAVTPDGYVLAATQSGRIWIVDPRRPGHKIERYDAKECIDSAPLQVDQTVFTAAKHTFYALQSTGGEKWQPHWSFEMEGSLVCSPIVWQGWVFLGDTHGWLYALDQENGQELWRCEMQPHGGKVNQHQVYGLCMQEGGRLAIAARSGQVVCLPWRLGQYECLAERLEGRWEKKHKAQNKSGSKSQLLSLADQAATCWAAAASITPQLALAQQQRQKAAHLWEESGHLEKAAYLWLDAGERRLAAESFTRAALGKREIDPKKAASWLDLALHEWGLLLWNIFSSASLDDEQKQRETSQVEAARQKSHEALAHIPSVDIPLLKLRTLNLPNLIERAEGKLILEMRNTGKATGVEVNLVVGGGLVETYRLPRPGEPLPPFERGAQWAIEVPLQATCSTLLRVDLNYCDETRRFEAFQTTLAIPMQVKEAMVLEARDIGLLKLEQAANVIINGRSFGTIRAASVEEINASGNIGWVKNSSKITNE